MGKYDDISLSDTHNYDKIVLETVRGRSRNTPLRTVPVNPFPVNPIFWLDPTANADIIVQTGVSSWTDHLGSGVAVTQAILANQPLLVPNLLNGLQMVRFDGINDSLIKTPWNIELKNGSAILVVCIPRFVPSAVKNQALLRWMPSNAAGYQTESTVDANVPSRNRLESFTQTNAGLIRATPVAQVDKDVARLQTVVVDPSIPSISQYRNGVLEGGPSGGFATVSSSIGDTFKIGWDEDVNISFGQYDVGDVVVFNQALTNAQRIACEAIFLSKWGF